LELNEDRLVEGTPLENRPLPSSKFTRDDAFAEIGAIDNSKQNFRLDTVHFSTEQNQCQVSKKIQ
jgi:hypothetical protein